MPGKQLFGFLVSVTNPTDINNSIARVELQITYLLSNDVKAICRIPHNQELAEKDRTGEPQEASVFSIPSRIDAHQTLLGWFLFFLDDSVIGEGRGRCPQPAFENRVWCAAYGLPPFAKAAKD